MSTEDLLGRERKLYLNTGTRASAVWVEMGRAKDSSLGLGKSEADISRKASGFKLSRGALKELELNFGYQYTTAEDAVFDDLFDSYWNDTALEFAVMDGDIDVAGSWGVRFYGEVISMPEDDPLEDGSTFDVTVKPTSFYVTGALQEPLEYLVSA